MRLVPPVLALGLALAAAAALAQGRAPSLRYEIPPLVPAPRTGAAASAAASPNAELEKAGQVAAHGWLLLLDRKDWGTAWDASSQMFHQAVPLPAWMEGIPKVREPFGAFIERQPVQVAYKSSLPGRPPGDYVTVLFSSKFANKADVEETVTTVREPDGRWRVTGYTAR